MTDQFRAMCSELVGAWDATSDFDFNDFGHAASDIADRARALLAQPVAEGPTDEELEKLAEPFSFVGEPGLARTVYDEAGYARAVLARFGRPTPQPVPYTERLQAVEALAADAVSGLRYIEQTHGRLYGVGWDRVFDAAAKFLPANALPTPEATNG